jgi:arsenate reductase
MGEIEIVRSDIEHVRSLLEANDLPIDDLEPSRIEMLAARDGDGRVVGSVGLERYGNQALVRSLAVDEQHRGMGVGAALLSVALEHAKSNGAADVFAVTTAAAEYLTRFGFEPIDRSTVRGEVAASTQLNGACPDGATVLMKRLRPVVLFMCVHNAGRSQMAAALLSRRVDGRVDVRSAGSEPADAVNPAVLEVMGEIGIDLSQEVPKLMTFDLAREADIVITMGCGDACPVFPGKRYLDWELPDPAGRAPDEVRPIRDEIEQRVDELVEELGISFQDAGSDALRAL